MWEFSNKLVDHFVPPKARDEWSSYMMVRTFVFLHLFGPLLGHSVIFFLYSASEQIGWVFWALEINLCFFWLMPFLVRRTGGLTLPATPTITTRGRSARKKKPSSRAISSQGRNGELMPP